MRVVPTLARTALAVSAVLMFSPRPSAAGSTGAWPPESAVTLTGAWTRLEFADPEPRELPSMIFDPVRGRLVLFGGFDGAAYHDETWEIVPGGSGWHRMSIDGPRPPGRSRHVAVYDPVTDAMIVYGGWAGAAHFDDIWSLDLKPGGGWHPIEVAGGPRPVRRGGCEGALDPARHELVIGNGETDHRMLNDAWAFSLESRRWRLLRPEGRGGLSRSHLALAYDSRRNRWLGFGGVAGDGAHNELFSWDVGRRTGWAWMDFAGQGPMALIDPCAVYDPVRDQLIVLGGSGFPTFAMELSTIALSEETRGPPLHLPGEEPPPLHGACAVYDPVWDRVLMFGGTTETTLMGDLWELSLGDDMHWKRLVMPHLPPARAYASSVYDALHQRWVVMFGNGSAGSLSDVWTFDFLNRQWTEIPITISGTWPGGVFAAAATYDEKHDRILLFGGDSGTAVNQDTWLLDLNTQVLTHLAYTGTYPLKRWGAAAFYDTTRDEMMLFGGTPEGVTHFCCAYYDAWSFQTPDPVSVTCTQWQVPPARPVPNAFGSGIFDPVARRFVMVSGQQEGGGFLAGSWGLSVDDTVPEWRYYGRPGQKRDGTSCVYDPTANRMLMFGGNIGTVRKNDVWEMPLVDEPWFAGVTTTGTRPDPRYRHAACFDAEARRLYVFGGAAYVATTNTNLYGDLWQLDLAGTPTWTRLLESPPWPQQANTQAMLYDPPRDRLLLFGGSAQDSAMWALDLGTALRWERLPVPGPSPGWRRGPSLVHDARRDRIILTGGTRGSGQAMKDTWALTPGDPSAWTEIVPRDSLPEGGENASTVYDSLRDRVITFGGDETTALGRWEYPHNRPGAFALSLEDPTWRALEIVGAPPGHRANQAAVYDPANDRILAFGGLDDYFGYALDPTVDVGGRGDSTGAASVESGGIGFMERCDTWAIAADGTAFTYTLLDSCSGPGQVFSPTTAIDRDAGRILLYGGGTQVWSRPLEGAGAWSPIALSGDLPGARVEHAATFDTRRHRMLIYGGAFASVNRLDLWQFLTSDWLVGVPPPAQTQVFSIGRVRPTPSRGPVTLELTLPDARPARIELFDVAGRRVAQRDLRPVTTGRHSVRMNETAQLPPGVYLLRVSRDHEARTARIVMVR